MINAKLVTCGLCQNYYADPRQIPCSHSFCFDCISGRFDEDTFTLVCPKCDKLHLYQSLEEFHQRCMRDGFLASMVTQFKKSQSRLSAVPPGFTSRPASTVPHMSPVFSSTPVHLLAKQEASDSGRCTPSGQQQPGAAPSLVAKCRLCNKRAELIVCDHCDNVICMKCAGEHRSAINDDVKREWDMCKTRFEIIHEQSIRYDNDEDEAKNKARNLQIFISKQSNQLIQTVENQKQLYIDAIEKHRRTHKQSFVHEQVVDEYESIDKRVSVLFTSNDVTTDQVNDFLFEIEHLEERLDFLNSTLEGNELQFPILTLPEHLDTSSLFGALEFAHVNTDAIRSDLPSSQLSNGHQQPHPLPMKSNDDDFVLINPSNTSADTTLSSSTSNPDLQRKKLLWQIDYFSVPYYVRTCANQLFVCDKYGSLAIYRLAKPNDVRQKPVLQREMKLFKDHFGSSANDEDQIIDSFVVYKQWIIVFKRKKSELHGTIYWFTLDGKLIPNGKCVHNHPSRELTIDTENNVLWSLDQKQLSLFYYDLPGVKATSPESCLQTRHCHVQFTKPFAPIHISVNSNALAVLDKNRQAVHVYDKQTKQKMYEYVNVHNRSTHFCWDMALFADNSLLIKLDEMSTLKSGPSKHIYLQLDASRQQGIIGTIEEADAYGMMITATDEILIGVRTNTKGIVKCYV